MKIRAYLNAARRLSRSRSGVWWTLPVAAVGVLLTLSYSTLTRADFTPSADKVFNYGGMNTAVFFNGYVSTIEGEFRLTSSIEELQQVSGNAVCAEINAIVQADARSGDIYSYREFVPPCSPDAWGYTLTAGRWPTGPGEVVATSATGLTVGEAVRGTTPEDLLVVGVASNPSATRSQTLIAGSGTWRSWGWPEVSAAFPRLSATVIAYTTTDRSEEVVDFYRDQNEVSPLSETIDISPYGETGESNVDRFPFLYQWIAVPLAALATLIALGLRGRYLSSREYLLKLQGISPRVSAVIAQASTLIPIAVATISGVIVGWLLSYGSTAIVEWIAGRAAGPMQLPADQSSRMIIGVGVVWVTALVVAAEKYSFAGRVSITIPNADNVSHSTLRQVLAIFTIGVAIFLLFVVRDVTVIIGSMFLVIVALALIAPELVLRVSRTFDRGSPGNKLAWRRVSQRPIVAAMGVTAAAIAFGPIIGLGIIISSDIAEQNNSARLPPAAGQAMYYLSDDDDVNAKVVDLMSSRTGSDQSLVYLPTIQTADGGGVVASAEGFGAVEAIASVKDLETLLGAPVSTEAAAILEAGGVLWGPEYSEAVLWAFAGDSLRPIGVYGATTEQFEERWARSSAGFILQSTAESLGFTLTDAVAVFGGVSEAEADSIGDELIDQGLDSSLVRTYRPEDPYSVSPFQWGLVGLIGFIGVGLLAAAMRGSVDSLRRQSPGLVALGAPRGWLGRVYLREGAATLLIGVVLGGASSIAVAIAGIVQLGIGVVVPYVLVGIYLMLLFLGLVAIGLFGFARIRS